MVNCDKAEYISLTNSNFNSTFIALNLRQKTDSKAHHTKNIAQYSQVRDIAEVRLISTDL